MKRIFCLLLTLVTVLSLALPAQAALITLEVLKDTYTDPDTGTTLTYPRLWNYETVESSSIKIKFTSSSTGSPLMQYGSADLWSTFSAATQSKLSRSDCDNSQFSKSDIAKVIGVKAKDIKIVTLGNQEYFSAEVLKTKQSGKIKLSVTAVYWICIDNGWLYIYQFAGDTSSPDYGKFESIVASASYGQAPALYGGNYLEGIYRGDEANSIAKGVGTLIWEKSSFSGTFKNGFPCGEGTFFFSDGTCMTGSNWGWVSEVCTSWVPERKGAEMFYTGMTLDGEFCGFGFLSFSSGGTFRGEFKDNDPNGWGIYVYRSPSSDSSCIKEADNWITVHEENRLKNCYTGLKVNKKWQGFGIGVLKSGYCYCGEIVNDYRDGHGELYTKKDVLERWGIYRKGTIKESYPRPKS